MNTRSSKKPNTIGYHQTPTTSTRMGYQKQPSSSTNSYKKNASAATIRSNTGTRTLLSSSYKKNNATLGGNRRSRDSITSDDEDTPAGPEGDQGLQTNRGSRTASNNNFQKNNTAIRGLGSSTGSVRSKSFGYTPRSGGDPKPQKIIPISEVDPMMDDISIKGRCISIWQSHRLNAAHDPYSLDLVLQDANNNRIQVYVKKEFMFRFIPLFEVGQCYILSRFGIAENSGKLPLLPHRYKISVYKYTTVTRIDPFDSNNSGLILEPFTHLLDPEHHPYYENEAVDVIGSVVGIGDIVPIMSAAGKKIRRTVVLEGEDGNRLDLTFWDKWASMWDTWVSKHEEIDHLVVILQLGKVKYWDGIPAIHNALFGTKIYVNRNMPEISAFKKRVQEREGYEAEQVKIELIAPEVKVVTIAEFFHGSISTMIGDIRECEPESQCIVYGRIQKIQKEHGWAYTGCKKCNKKVDILPRQNRPTIYVCEEHGNVQAASRFKVIVRIMDNTGSAPILFFNNNFVKLSGYTAWELLEKYNMDPDEYWPEELDCIVGKECLFKLFYSQFNVSRNNHIYRCDSFSQDEKIINHFKNNFYPDTEEAENTGEFLECSGHKNKTTNEDSSIHQEPADEFPEDTLIEHTTDDHESEIHPEQNDELPESITHNNKATIEKSSDEPVPDLIIPSNTTKATIEKASDEPNSDFIMPYKTTESTSKEEEKNPKKRKTTSQKFVN